MLEWNCLHILLLMRLNSGVARTKVGETTNQGVWRTEVPWRGPGSGHLVRALWARNDVHFSIYWSKNVVSNVHILAAWDKIEKVQRLVNDEYRRILCTRLPPLRLALASPSHHTDFLRIWTVPLMWPDWGWWARAYLPTSVLLVATPQLSDTVLSRRLQYICSTFCYWIFAPCYLHFVHRHSQNFRCCGCTPSRGVILKLDILNGFWLGFGKSPFPQNFEFFRLEMAFSIAFLCIMHVIAGF